MTCVVFWRLGTALGRLHLCTYASVSMYFAVAFAVACLKAFPHSVCCCPARLSFTCQPRGSRCWWRRVQQRHVCSHPWNRQACAERRMFHNLCAFEIRSQLKPRPPHYLADRLVSDRGEFWWNSFQLRATDTAYAHVLPTGTLSVFSTVLKGSRCVATRPCVATHFFLKTLIPTFLKRKH